PHQFHQKQILEAARSILAHRYEQFETLASLFANTGIRRRYGVKPIEWYLEPRGWPERTNAFLDGAEALFITVAQDAIARASRGQRHRHRCHRLLDRHRDADLGSAPRR